MYIYKKSLDVKDTGGAVGKVEYATNIPLIPAGTHQASLDTRTGLNPGYDKTNLSAKFKNPRVKQDLPEKARNQYM